MNITLTGNLGSGKGSVSKFFQSWGFGYVSGGDLFRGVAKEKGISVLEMNKLAEKDRSIDDLIDARSTRLGDELDNTLFDSRLAWHFVRESFKVFLLVDTDESARRVFEGDARESETYDNVEACAAGLEGRAKSECARFATLYNVDYYDMKNYDLIVESTNASKEEVAKVIRDCFEEYKVKPFKTRVLLNLKAMYPQGDLTRDELNEIAYAGKIRETEGDSLISDKPVKILSSNGYNYISENAIEFLKDAAAGKAFAQVDAFRLCSVNEQQEIKTPSKLTIREIENAANFKYRAVPAVTKVKHNYMMDLSC